MRRIGLFLLTNLLVVIVISIILSFLGLDAASYTGLLVICSVFGMLGAFISLSMSKWIAKRSYRIQVIDPNQATGKELKLYNAIYQMASYHKISCPEVGIYQSNEVNAFATGASKNNSIIAFSSRLVDNLNDEEIEAVAAHELSHIVNGDMLTMTLLTGVANTFVMFFARVLAFAIDNAMRQNRRGGLGYLGYWMMIILLENVLMLLAYIPICYFSRQREYRADAGAASLTAPGAMITALQKIDSLYFPQQKKDSFALAKISNRHRASLYATHPSIPQRVEKLKTI
ncbi:MAG: protease HtpX [Candidatus Cloacimonetes bacterium]|nr:protease HtpX [Candidatus Cloacimonadota bacterium]